MFTHLRGPGFAFSIVALLTLACGDASTPGTVDGDLLAEAATTAATTADPPPTTLTAPPTTLPAPPTTLPAPPTTAVTTTTMVHDDEMGHDEEGSEHEEGAHDGTEEMASGEFDREIEVVMSEFAFDPATISVSAGETVRFVLVNEGVVPHEFRLTTEHAAAEHIAAGHEGHGDDGGEGDHGHDEVLLEVAAGATDTLTVTFAEDAEWDQFACLIPGHYEAGMLGDLQLG